ncbi:MAG: UDP-N-acetyl-D-mannosaminuronic acid dehydrogenase [Gammaproteobacteria bacterium RIFCSPHIGHO2_02_FULL_39_13]|nr:MAG: UDP-N-acetyl-D-mannosaminuronic acid dehydrogenase [Gammaproteobacteria bacterium RIFCSPHIGHO2_02_FULL_39_13]OGT48489.1 MAG: UDP-N-acetyl-D-mannosaminuronic acid dehydrogenase [Gammaproteobacteria bacterium RIFCSPHIGHO2_12_FULL_39_24]
MNVQTICVVGLGYIGLPSAAVLASCGQRVIGCDIQRNIIDTINEGKTHLAEPELELLVYNAVRAGKLTAQLSVPKADVYVITVPTPITEKNEPDISYVKAAIESIAPQLEKNNLIIIESTSPVGTTEQAAQWIQKLRPDLADIYLAYCPERVMPGQIIRELVENDRVVGGINFESTQKAIAFYKLFVKGECIATTAKTAEMTKLTENAFRDVNIAFANELSMICDQENINVWELIALANRHPRVKILQPGAGVGGHCIAVDPWFIVASHPLHAKLIRTAREVNDHKARYVLNTILKTVSTLENPVIACLGIAFKKDVDDLRESPALMIVDQLAEKTSGKICVVEPHIKKLPAVLAQHRNVTLTNLEEALVNADIVVILVAHSVFTKEKLNKLYSGKLMDVVGLMGKEYEASFAIT